MKYFTAFCLCFLFLCSHARAAGFEVSTEEFRERYNAQAIPASLPIIPLEPSRLDPNSSSTTYVLDDQTEIRLTLAPDTGAILRVIFSGLAVPDGLETPLDSVSDYRPVLVALLHALEPEFTREDARAAQDGLGLRRLNSLKHEEERHWEHAGNRFSVRSSGNSLTFTAEPAL